MTSDCEILTPPRPDHKFYWRRKPGLKIKPFLMEPSRRPKRSKGTAADIMVGVGVDWPALPPELMLFIAKKLTEISHCIRFRSVCSSWRSAASPTELVRPCQPLMVVPPPTYIYGDGVLAISYFNIKSGELIYGANTPDVPASFIYGSSHGWLLMVGRPSSSHIVSLFNPMTTSEIPLPLLPRELNLRLLQKAVICAHPASSLPDKLLTVIWTTEKLAFLRQGHIAWTLVDCLPTSMRDILYFNEKLYVVDSVGRLAVLQIESPMLIPMADLRPPKIQFPFNFSLVEAVGDLLLVIRHFTRKQESEKLVVFKLERSSNEKLSWKRIGITNTIPRRKIHFICAQGVPYGKGYRIYMAHEASRPANYIVLGRFFNDTAIVDVVDVDDDRITYIQQHFWEKSENVFQHEWRIPPGVTWMVPSLY